MAGKDESVGVAEIRPEWRRMKNGLEHSGIHNKLYNQREKRFAGKWFTKPS
jgi:hypothetical protein